MLLKRGIGLDLRRGHGIFLFKKLAEMVNVVISHLGGHLLYARVLSAFQKLLGPFQTDIDQETDRRISRLALKNLRNVKRAQIHIFRNLIQ